MKIYLQLFVYIATTIASPYLAQNNTSVMSVGCFLEINANGSSMQKKKKKRKLAGNNLKPF